VLATFSPSTFRGVRPSKCLFLRLARKCHHNTNYNVARHFRMRSIKYPRIPRPQSRKKPRQRPSIHPCRDKTAKRPRHRRPRSSLTRIDSWNSTASGFWARSVQMPSRKAATHRIPQGGFARVYEVKDVRGTRHACKVVTKTSLKTKKAKTKVCFPERSRSSCSHLTSCTPRSRSIARWHTPTSSAFTNVLKMTTTST
jgi:hypothetical protein